MEKKIRALFQLQSFEQNSRLSRLISETENRFASRSLSDDDMEYVSAAGDVEALNAMRKKIDSKKKKE